MRILGLDYGTKTVGVAVSDELLITAQGVEIIRRKSPSKLRQTLARIEELVEEYGADRIVLGYPKNMNNTEGVRCEETKEFQEMLERRTGKEVILWDERLTTVAADKAIDMLCKRRFTRTVMSKNCNKLSLFYIQIHMIKGCRNRFDIALLIPSEIFMYQFSCLYDTHT